MSNLVQNKRMHIMNIFPFVGVRYIMYYHGKRGDWLVTLWIQWNVILAELELARVSNQANFTRTVSLTTFNKPPPRTRRGAATTIHQQYGEDCAWGSVAWIQHAKKKKNNPPKNTFLPHVPSLKKPIVIQLVQVQLRAFQLQIRGELRIRIDNQARSLPKTQASR